MAHMKTVYYKHEVHKSFHKTPAQCFRLLVSDSNKSKRHARCSGKYNTATKKNSERYSNHLIYQKIQILKSMCTFNYEFSRNNKH